MKTARTLAEFDALRASLTGSCAFVPTMGALHEGHLSLVAVANEHATHTIASIFVNPRQFGEGEDFDTYPRHVEADLRKLESAGIALAFLPRLEDVYPAGAAVEIQPGPAASGLESHSRPHFFKGVATVVHRLFDMVRPDLAVFGEKDYQQLQVIRDMVSASEMSVEIVGAPTIRDDYGLALSSRNAYLSATEVDTARQLNRVISSLAGRIATSDIELKDLSIVENQRISSSECTVRKELRTACVEAQEELLEAGFDSVDYVAIRSAWNRVLAAATIGSTRLIDNYPIRRGSA